MALICFFIESVDFIKETLQEVKSASFKKPGKAKTKPHLEPRPSSLEPDLI